MRRAPVAAALGLALSVAAGIVPAALPGLPVPSPLVPAAVLAADDIEIATETRYTVDPGDRRVRVVVEVTAVNRKPNAVTGGGVTRFFFDGVNLGVQPEARGLRATQDGDPIRVRTVDREGFRLATLLFRENLYFGETARLRLAFHLPAGRPRSDSDVRVGPAFATFTAWAFGDRGRVRIEVPSGFRVEIAGEDMDAEPGRDGLQAWVAEARDALEWYAWVNATNDDALTRERLALQGGDEIVIRGWPEDERWRARVRSLLRDGVPDLVARIGLPWPVDGSLEVIEVHTPLLEGYAGFYDPEADEITISEDLDDLTIIHEASHAWFNGSLFTERWITEGLADEYAALVLRAAGRGDPAPDRVTPRDAEAFPLLDWPPPAAIRDEAAEGREAYGYAASWTVVRRIVARVGEDGMRKVFAAAAAGTTSYPGEDAPERSRLPNDWRRFLDLTEEAEARSGAGEAPGAGSDGGGRSIAELVELWALDEGAAALLPARASARAAYAELVAAGGSWAPPEAVRVELDGWDFRDARDRIDQARAVLGTRDATAGLAAAEGLVPDPALEDAYQDAGSASELAVLDDRAARGLEVLEAIVAAGDAVEAPRDWLADWGLDGVDPAADLAAAGEAWERGALDEAETAASAVVARLAAAPGAGRTKAIVAGAIAAAALVLLLIVGLVVAGRRRGPRPVGAAAPGTGAHATLPPHGPPPDAPGGPASGDEGADRP